MLLLCHWCIALCNQHFCFPQGPSSGLVLRFASAMGSADEVSQSAVSGTHPRLRFRLHQQEVWCNRSSPVECLHLLLRRGCPYYMWTWTQHNYRLYVLNINCLPSWHLSKGSEDKNLCRAQEVTSACKVPLCSWPIGTASSLTRWSNWTERFFQNHTMKILRGGKKTPAKSSVYEVWGLSSNQHLGCIRTLWNCTSVNWKETQSREMSGSQPTSW